MIERHIPLNRVCYRGSVAFHLAGRRQKLIIGVLSRDGDAIAIVWRQVSQIPCVGFIRFWSCADMLPPVCHSPVRVLDVVAIAVVGTILARLAGKVHLGEAECRW